MGMKKKKNNKKEPAATGSASRLSTAVYTPEERASEARNRRKALFLTWTLFTGVIIAFMFLGFRTPLPLPEEKGIDVVLGTVDYGEQPQAERAEEIPEEPSTEPEPQQPTASSQPVESTEEVVTSDAEDVPEVEAQQEPQEEEAQPEQPVEEPQKEEQDQEEPPEDPEEKQQPQVDPNALYTGQNKSKGEENQPGDKGAADGSEASSSFEKKGSSDEGSGISFNLEGRSMRQRPDIKDDSQKYGKVVVEIVVNQDGDVIRATAGKRGSTTTDRALLKKAREAAFKAKFSPNAQAPDEQIGTMIFNFRLR